MTDKSGMDSEEELEVSGDKRELQGEAPRSKRIKALTLTADGKWEEEEESVEFSDSDDEETGVATEAACKSKSSQVATKSIPLLWSGNMLPSSKAAKDSDSDESEDDYVAWSWMKKPEAESAAEVVETIDIEEDIDPDASPRKTSACMEGELVPPPQGESNLSTADACQDQDPEVGLDLQEGDGDVEDAELQQAIEPDMAEAREDPIQETGTETNAPELGYAPGKLLAWLLQPTNTTDDQSEESADESDSDVFPDEALSDSELLHDEDVRERLSDDGNAAAEPKRTSRLPEPSSERELSARSSRNHLGIVVPGRGEYRRKGNRQMPKLRGSIRLCFPVGPSCAEESKHDDSTEDLPSPLLGQRIQYDGPWSTDLEQRVAIGVLARHAVRLGAAGLRLESAVIAAVHRTPPDSADFNRWEFLVKKAGIEAYIQAKLRVQQIYAKYPRDLKRADEESRQFLPLLSTLGVPTSSPEAKGADISPAFIVMGKPCMVNLPISELRFAHDSQREHFGHKASARINEKHRSVLQLAVEMLTGFTLPSAVPCFRACHHNGHWYCYNGNRRLAAFRLAHRFAPERFGRLQLPVALADDVFLKGSATCQQRFTTARNGADCNGLWMFFLETGEAVGHTLPGCKEYGCDLLSLLPKLDTPLPTPQAHTSSAALAQGNATGSIQGSGVREEPISQNVVPIKADLGAATAGA